MGNFSVVSVCVAAVFLGSCSKKAPVKRASASAVSSAVGSTVVVSAVAPKPTRFCGPWLEGARLNIVSLDGGVSFFAWAESPRQLSVEQAFAWHVSNLRDVDIVARDESRLFIHWMDPCDEPMAGFIKVKLEGGVVVVLASRWPHDATDNLRSVFDDLFADLGALPPGGCSARQWLNQPGQYAFQMRKSAYAEDFEVVSSPTWVCPPFAFRVPPFRNEGVPDTPLPKEPFYW